MYAFKYHRPTTVRQAAGLLAREEEAKLLAGGHTLIPTMKLRLAGPKHIIDMSKIEGLSGIEMGGRSVTIGAMTRHVEVANSSAVKEAIPALADLAGQIGDPAVRHRRHHRRLDRQQRSQRRLSGRRCSGSAPRSSPTSGASRRTSSSKACSRPRSSPTRSSPRCSFPKPNKAAYVKFRNPASRYALVGVFVSKRGSDIRVAVTGRRRQRRVPRALVRGGAEEALRRQVARRHDHSGRRHERRYPWQRRIPRPSGRRAGAPRGRRCGGRNRASRSSSVDALAHRGMRRA